MRPLLLCLVALTLILGSSVAQTQSIDEYTKKAGDYERSGQIDEAVKTMEEAIAKYPDNSTAHSFLGLYLGMKAGRTTDFMEAGRLIGKSFELLDKAVLIDPDNPMARFHRGLLGVNVPPFLGKMETGIKDLERLIEISKESPDKVSKDILVNSYNFLAQAYQKGEEKQKAESAWRKVVELDPGSDLAKNAEANLKSFSEAKPPEKGKAVDSAEIADLKKKMETEPENPALLMELGKAYVGAGDFEGARKVLEKLIKVAPDNLEAHKLLMEVLGELAGRGYDEKVHTDTDYRTNLAFEVIEVLDKAIKLAPDDVELRLSRGIMGVQMPFFVEKLDQGMEDLNWVMKSSAVNSTKAEALYWLGSGYQKKAMTYWIKVVTDYPGSNACQSVFETMRPGVKRLDITKYQLPVLAIDSILGFRDELPPQAAVWIEDNNGRFIKTIYVSGFSGHAREKQANLPEWSKSSKFSDVDGVTSASIDMGHHIHVWDLKDSAGNKVETGEYTVKVEVAYWPSGQYQLVSASINLGKEKKSTTEKGNLIPYLGIEYYIEF